MKTLDHVVALTIRKFKSGEGVEALADHLGVKVKMLYRLSNPLDEGARINSKHLIPLMEKTRDYSILRHIAARLGFGVFRIPRVRTAREGEIAKLQKSQSDSVQMILGFYAGTRSREETIAAIDEELERAAGFRKAVERGPAQGLFE